MVSCANNDPHLAILLLTIGFHGVPADYSRSYAKRNIKTLFVCHLLYVKIYNNSVQDFFVVLFIFYKSYKLFTHSFDIF